MSTRFDAKSPGKEVSRNSSPRLSYLPGLDGLRALAVTAVLLYHADLGWMPGGFLGVEIFFVISGYLITSLLLSEWESRGSIDLKGFWQRRARRLLPALLVLLSSTLAFAVALLPGEVASLRGDAAAALVYSANWYFILAQKSYFQFVGRPSLFQHLWSLAVEEQFYLLWPPLLLLLLRLLPRRRILPLVLAGATASAVLMAVLYDPNLDPSRVYYGTDTRAGGLLLGAALAFVWTRPGLAKRTEQLNPVLVDAAGAVGLVVLLGACLWMGEYSPLLYRGGFALVGLATALVIAVAVHPRARLGDLLGREPLHWIGTRSYGIYLWHWPVFMITRPQLDVPLDGPALLLLRVALTLSLTELSYRLIETPIRRGALGRLINTWRRSSGSRRRAFTLRFGAAAASILIATAGLGESVVSAQVPAPPAYLAVTHIDTVDAVNTPSPLSGPAIKSSGTARPAQPEALPLGNETATPTAIPLGGDVASSIPVTSPAAASLPSPAGGITTSISPSVMAAPTSATAITQTLISGAGSILAVGDSVLLGAAGAIEKQFPGIGIDAKVGRAFIAGIQVVQGWRAAGKLGAVVIVHLGDNGPITADQFDLMMQTLSGVRQVVIVNDKVPRPWQDPNNALLSQEASKYSNIVLVDWYAASSNHPEFFWNDGMHLRPEGAAYYAGLLAKAIAPQE